MYHFIYYRTRGKTSWRIFKGLRIWILAAIAVILAAAPSLEIFTNAQADSGTQIPKWFRNDASLWLSGNMSDQQFMDSIHKLVTSLPAAANYSEPAGQSSVNRTAAKNCEDKTFRWWTGTGVTIRGHTSATRISAVQTSGTRTFHTPT